MCVRPGPRGARYPPSPIFGQRSGGIRQPARTVPVQAGRPRPPSRPHTSPPAEMSETERLSKLRHDLSNPLSALLAETQLLLLNESQIDAEVVAGLREIEALAIRMRAILREH